MSLEFTKQFSVIDENGEVHDVAVYAEFTVQMSITFGMQMLPTGRHELRIGDGTTTLTKLGDGEYVLSGSTERFTSIDSNRF